MKGTFRITMVLPAWTVENELTLDPQDGGTLMGYLDTLDGNPPTVFSHAVWNKQFFQIDLAVGPGQLRLTGRVDGDELHGVVVIDDTPDCLSGVKIR